MANKENESTGLSSLAVRCYSNTRSLIGPLRLRKRASTPLLYRVQWLIRDARYVLARVHIVLLVTIGSLEAALQSRTSAVARFVAEASDARAPIRP